MPRPDPLLRLYWACGVVRGLMVRCLFHTRWSGAMRWPLVHEGTGACRVVDVSCARIVL